MSEIKFFESTNDYYLVNCVREGLNGHFYMKCTFSNGLTEVELSRAIGKYVPTILIAEVVKKSLEFKNKLPF